MSAIFGIGIKDSSLDRSLVREAVRLMGNALAAEPDQAMEFTETGPWIYGALYPSGHRGEPMTVGSGPPGVHMVVQGQVYIEPQEKARIIAAWPDAAGCSGNALLPYLYRHYGDRFPERITGWFNLFLFDEKTKRPLICNDRLGMLPLYFYEDKRVFIFGSGIEAVAASGLLKKTVFDPVTMAEYLLFHYPVSEHTFFKGVSKLPPASIRDPDDAAVLTTYWTPASLIGSNPLPEKESVELISQALSETIRKPFGEGTRTVAATLTGGFDGRLILSHLLDDYSDRLEVFSFGAAHSPDITIPAAIAEKELFRFTPVILDKRYIEEDFSTNAAQTVILSGGLRSFRRTHYLYAIKKMSAKAEVFISGNFGDEVIKFARILPSAVISQSLISLLNSGFSSKYILSDQAARYFSDAGIFKAQIREELISRIESVEKKVEGYQLPAHRYHHLKYTLVAPGFFGNEMASYGNYMQNFPPFLDHDFLKAFHSTVYAGIYHPFNANRLEHKEMATRLYADLIRIGHKDLLKYNTDRGYSMKATENIIGRISILLKKFTSKYYKTPDNYYLTDAEKYYPVIDEKDLHWAHGVRISEIFTSYRSNLNNTEKDLIQSLVYWIRYISTKLNPQF
ncbi:MAG: hypothetical protein KBC43_01295 [Bacteroidales bacterium]|nr:hypothetical protein [Bacteroidales bacterium]